MFGAAADLLQWIGSRASYFPHLLRGGSMSQRWTVWTAAAVGSFGLLEGHAVARREQTLSLWLRHRLGVEPKHPRRFILEPLWVAFWVWLTGHILGDWGPYLEKRDVQP